MTTVSSSGFVRYLYPTNTTIVKNKALQSRMSSTFIFLPKVHKKIGLNR